MSSPQPPEHEPIPAVAHFIWLGPQLPWFALMAIRSARERGGFDRIILHIEPILNECPHVQELRRLDDIELREIDPTVLFEKLESAGLPSLAKAYAGLVAPAPRSDLIRLATLALEGGVYLDVDTITVRDFDRLRRRASAFVGTECIAHPSTKAGALVQQGLLHKQALIGLRNALSRVGFGWRAALRIQHLYPQVANNAIMGATEGHPFIMSLLAHIAAMTPEGQRMDYALGPHLIQAELAHGNPHGVEILHPEVLFPLGPVISMHWFRLRRSLPALSQIIAPETIAIHWYASSPRLSSVLPACDDAYIRSNCDRQLYSRISCRILDNELDAELAH